MICFRQSRLKLIAVTALFAAWTIAFAFMAFVSAYLNGLWPYVGLTTLIPLAAAFGVATFMTAMGLATPATLTLDGETLVFKTWRAEQRIAWTNVEEFTILSPESRLRSPGVRLKQGARRIVSFGRYWEKEPAAIVEQLDNALIERDLQPGT